MEYTPLITCEHAGNIIPAEYQSLFSDLRDILNSHEGWDPGAWEVALHLGKQLNIKAHGCQTSRLLIESNRSLNSPQLFSRFSNDLNKDEKTRLIQKIYLPYRTEIESQMKRLPKPVLHLSIHSFTPVLNKIERNVDVGLLFDPKRKKEYQCCGKLKAALNLALPGKLIQFNEPYLGTDDGFTTFLRAQYNEFNYLGIEIEINQKFISDLGLVKQALSTALTKVLSTNF